MVVVPAQGAAAVAHQTGKGAGRYWSPPAVRRQLKKFCSSLAPMDQEPAPEKLVAGVGNAKCRGGLWE